MRYLLPLAVLVVGLAFGAYALEPYATREITPSDTAAARTFSPESRLFAQAAHDVPVISEPPIVSSTSGRPSWRPVITAVGEFQYHLNSVQPEDEYARTELARDLQRELKRVGCYDGSLDGHWNTGTKRAMGVFTDRVNAMLPLGQPDYILLSLVRGQHSQVCGKNCPSGQTLAQNGRCLPSAILANTAKSASVSKHTPASDAKTVPDFGAPNSISTEATTVPPVPLLPGRMAIGGPMPDAARELPQAPPIDDASVKRSSAPRQVRSIDDLFIHPLNPL